MNRNSKIEQQISMPQKPKLGTISDWMFSLLFLGLALIIMLCGFPEEKVMRLILVIICLVLLVIGFISLIDIFVKFFKDRREYILSRKDEQSYRHLKALEFVEHNLRCKTENELLVEFRKIYPSKKLPDYVENAIYMHDALTLQQYLEEKTAENMKKKEKNADR